MVKQTFENIVTEIAETHASRNGIYKDGYAIGAKILHLLFPDGVDFSNPETASKYVLFENILIKVVRYGVALQGGFGNGHADSAHDIAVYAILLEQQHDRSER